ncbi:MAG: tripartite tricarboxylate transporter substrate binding protein [Planctomycetes bacterium]|nr:tripartite tricarboxylate transporter substrate binding protein [Planctomycetota bacterium]
MSAGAASGTARSLHGSVLLTLTALGCWGEGPYPDRPILLVCPWAPGGGTDRIARQVAAQLERELGVPVNVLNATGGAGVTGHSRGALARADGYTITMMTVEINMLHWRGMTSISYRDFEPLVLLGKDPAAVFVRADAPWRTLAELVEEARGRPGALKASGTAKLGIWHLAVGGWLRAAGLKPSDVGWIPSAGAAPSLQALISGGVDVACCSLPEAKALLEAGRIRCLGAMAATRLEGFPEVPTLREQGVGWEIASWRGIGAPKGTPASVRARLAAAIEKVARSDEFLVALRGAGFNTSFEPPAEFARTLERTDAELGAILSSEGFRELARDRFGPWLFPGVLAAALGGILAALAVRGGLRLRSPLRWGIPAGLRPCAEAVAAVVLYILLAEPLGFVATAGGLLAALLLRLGTRPRAAGLVVVLVVPAAYHLFAVVLRVPLPRGILGW